MGLKRTEAETAADRAAIRRMLRLYGRALLILLAIVALGCAYAAGGLSALRECTAARNEESR